MRLANDRRFRLLVSALALVSLCSACTVIRYRDADAGMMVPVEPTPPKIVDMLVLVDFDPNAVNLANAYAAVVENLVAALGRSNVEVRNRAVAPLHHRVGSDVPLLPADDPGTLEASIANFSAGPGAPFLRDAGGNDYANLIALGGRLANAPLYAVDGGGDNGQAHFEPAADGFVVVVVTGRAARCGGDCGSTAAQVASTLTASGASGASWLDLPGDAGLPPRKIAFALFTPPEVGTNYSDLAAACRARPNFPTAVLDFLQPSTTFHSSVATAVANGGGSARWVDLCAALSSESTAITNQIAASIAGAVR